MTLYMFSCRCGKWLFLSTASSVRRRSPGPREFYPAPLSHQPPILQDDRIDNLTTHQAFPSPKGVMGTEKLVIEHGATTAMTFHRRHSIHLIPPFFPHPFARSPGFTRDASGREVFLHRQLQVCIEIQILDNVFANGAKPEKSVSKRERLYLLFAALDLFIFHDVSFLSDLKMVAPQTNRHFITPG